MSNKYLLDASALLALLQGEKGSEAVAKKIPYSALSTVNMAEVASVLNKAGMPENEISGLFNEIDIEILSYERESAVATGGIRKLTQNKGLSLGDRACLATAKTHNRIVITADKVWLDFQQELGVDVELIR